MSSASEGIAINPTNRFTPVLLLIVALLVFSAMFTPDALYAAMALLSILVLMRGYMIWTTSLLLRCRIDVGIDGGFSTKPIVYTVRIENRGLIPIALIEFSLMYSPHLRLIEGSRAGVLFIPPKGVVTYRAVFDSRVGRHNIGPLKVVVRDPLGLYRTSEVELVKPVDVEVVPVADEAIVRRVWVMARSTGVIRVGEPGVGVEMHSVREYRPGDELRRVVWRTLASSGRLSVKEMEREAFQNIVFVVETSPAMFYGPYKTTPFEHTSTVIASIARYLAGRGDAMSIVIATPREIYTSGRPMRGRIAYIRISKLLAKTLYTVEEDVARPYILLRALNKLLEILPRERNLVFLFTAPGGSDYLSSLIDFSNKLRSLGNEVYIAMPLTIAYEVKGLPPWAQAVFRVKTFDMVRREIEFARTLARHRVKVLALGPQHMVQAIVNLVELKRAR